jgi:hypothetical protein
VESIITSEGTSVGSAEINTPSAEKQTLEMSIPEMSRYGCSMFKPSIFKTAISATEVISKLTIDDARISPMSIFVTLIGMESNLSRVLVLVSQGEITGVIAVDVNHKDIPARPATRRFDSISLPNINAKKKKKGSSIPKIRTGPFL